MNVEPHVLTSLDDGILNVTFNRPRTYNAMTFAMYDALEAACGQVTEEGVRAMVLRGAGGKAFVAGTDIPELETFVATNGAVAYEARIESVIAALQAVPVPVIAAVDGVAAGAGLLFVLASDICICTYRSRFGAPMARTLGNCLSIANMRRVVRGVGERNARLLLLSSYMIDARRARDVHLVADVVKPANLEEAVGALVARIQGSALPSLRATKQALDALAEPLGDAKIAESDAIVERCYGSPEFAEGARAFREKRKPSWRAD